MIAYLASLVLGNQNLIDPDGAGSGGEAEHIVRVREYLPLPELLRHHLWVGAWVLFCPLHCCQIVSCSWLRSAELLKRELVC